MESQNKETQEQLNIKDMNVLLENKEELGKSLEKKVENYSLLTYTIVNPTSLKAKRILQQYQVRYYLQIYVFDTVTNKFEIAEKSYKNALKEKLNSMSADKRYVRDCLLLMQEGEQTVFAINKSILKDLYDKKVKNFFEIKKKEKEKELRQIEREKILKEKEEEKKKNPPVEGVAPSPNPLPPQPKKEIKIDMEIVKNVPNTYKLEDCLYYRIFIEDVLIDRPGFPQRASDLYKYVTYFNEEITRLLKKKNYNEAESWCNEIKSKIINMGKGKVRNEYESEKFKEKKEEIEKLMKKPLLNLTFIYENKSNKDSDYINKAIDLIENIYYKRYKEFDENYLKITGRFIKFLVKVKDFSKAEKYFGILKENCKELSCYNIAIKELEPFINSAKIASDADDIKMSKGKINAAGKGTKPEYDWEKGSNEEELDKALKEDFDRVKANMEFVNNNAIN